MPDLDIQARKLNDRAIEIISRYIAAQGWTGLSLVTLLTKYLSSELHETCPTLTAVYPKERTAELSSDHRKRRHSAQPDRPSKRSAHGSSEDLGLMLLPKAAQHECQNTFVDPFHQEVGGPEITTYMTTTEKDGHLNTWMQDLAPWPVEEPDITVYMTAFTEEDQSNRWMQDLASWPVEEPDITAYMTTFKRTVKRGRRCKTCSCSRLKFQTLPLTRSLASKRLVCYPRSLQAAWQVQKFE